MRRRPELNRGIRPPADETESLRQCWTCRAPFILDRRRYPWSRAVTCSVRCARVKGNHDRGPTNCLHCVEVRDWRAQQDSEIRAIEVPAQDEDARPMTYRVWLERRADERRAEREEAQAWVA